LFAQFINGMSDMIQDRKSLPLAQFTEAVRSGTEAAYSAISNPVEGTMLTIMKDFASALREKADADYRTALEYGKKAVSKSLQKTKNQLEALKKAGVIDAGAKGILAFIEGFSDTWPRERRFQKKPKSNGPKSSSQGMPSITPKSMPRKT
jgi:dihydroxyacetone kinase-like predicted kinase